MTGSDELLAVIAHDVAAPLSGIRRLAEHLAGLHGELSPAAREIAAALAASAARTSTVLDDLLAYARAAAPAGRQRVAVDDLVRNVVADLQPLLEERQATVSWDPLPELWARPVAVRQILVNLISNVARHAGSPARAHISATHDEGGWVIHVRDDGPGMDDAARDVLEGDGPPAAGRLGLFLTRQLVRGEGGRLWVVRPPDGGTEVAFRLPQRQRRDQRPERARPSTASA